MYLFLGRGQEMKGVALRFVFISHYLNPHKIAIIYVILGKSSLFLSVRVTGKFFSIFTSSLILFHPAHLRSGSE